MPPIHELFAISNRALLRPATASARRPILFRIRRLEHTSSRLPAGSSSPLRRFKNPIKPVHVFLALSIYMAYDIHMILSSVKNNIACMTADLRKASSAFDSASGNKDAMKESMEPIRMSVESMRWSVDSAKTTMDRTQRTLDSELRELNRTLGYLTRKLDNWQRNSGSGT